MDMVTKEMLPYVAPKAYCVELASAGLVCDVSPNHPGDHDYTWDPDADPEL